MEKEKSVLIRVAELSDASELQKIYSYYVENTAISFEYIPPTVEEFTERIRNTKKIFPYLVAEIDGKVVGYIYASKFAGRPAYDWSAESSIYIDKDHRRMGIGKKLYEELERILILQNVTNLYAGASDPMEDEDEYLTRNSQHFHEAIGFEVVARFHGCGNKFNRWYNVIRMEKFISEKKCPPEKFIPFSELGLYK